MSETPRKIKAHGHILQADWNQTDPLKMDYIHNKPDIKSGEASGALVFNDTLNNIASADYAHAEGYETTASGKYSHAEGNGTTASAWGAHAEGSRSHAEGYASHAEGYSTTASEAYSHTEGYQTTASGHAAHAEGSGTTAEGIRSHAEGVNTAALADGSHAEGADTTAEGSYSHAEGYGTVTTDYAQHVQGKYNIKDTAKKYAHIVGNGGIKTVDGQQTLTYSNAHTLDWGGTAWFAKNVKIGGTGQNDTAAKTLATIDYVDTNTTLIKLKIWGETD